MASPVAPDPATLPLHVLFPDEYRASARMIVRDFALLGGALVAGLVTAAALAQLA